MLERSVVDQPSPQRIPALDAIRGLAILMVTVYRFNIGPDDPSLLGQGFISSLACGFRGVDLFFVLSGFLITGILYDAKGSAHYFRNFYMRRALRIFPLYYGCLIVVLLIFPLLVHGVFPLTSHSPSKGPPMMILPRPLTRSVSSTPGIRKMRAR